VAKLISGIHPLQTGGDF